MRIFICLTIVTLSATLQCYGQWFQPILRFTVSATYPMNDLQVVSGVFDVETRRLNLGFEFTNEFRLHKKLLIETGIRYTPVKTTVRGLNTSNDFLASPNPFTWTRNFGSLTVPILYTRYFKTKNNRLGKYFVGFATGFFVSNSAKDQGSTSVPINGFTPDTIVYSSFSSGDLEKDQFYASLDFGLRYYPFKKSKNLELGFLITYQLNRNKIGAFQGIVANISKNQLVTYQSILYQRFNNISLSVGYKFGTNKKKKRSDTSECPKY